LPGEQVEGLPTLVGAAYEEARRCLGVASYTACELVCRKILMHVAVDKGAMENQRFAVHLKYLSDQGYVTPPMRPWVDLIRQHGNEATHELPDTSKERAEATLSFTAQLLRSIYEMAHRARQYMPAVETDKEEQAGS